MFLLQYLDSRDKRGVLSDNDETWVKRREKEEHAAARCAQRHVYYTNI